MRAQHREYGRNTRTLFFRELAAGQCNFKLKPGRTCGCNGHFLKRRNSLLDRRQQNFAALVQRLNGHVTTIGGDNHRRVDNGRIPTRIAARIFVVGRENCAAPLVESIHITVDRAGIGRCNA